MASPQEHRVLDDDNQEETGRVDIERQIRQCHRTSLDSRSEDNRFRRLMDCCIDNLHKFQALKQRLQLSQNETRGTIPGSPSARLPSQVDQCNNNMAEQRCFLCLNKKESQTAIAIPCRRPTKERQIKSYHCDRGSKNRRPRYSEIRAEESAVEDDMAIFERLVEACYKYHGTWRKWIPYYGITKVQEVTFKFVGVADKDGTFPIAMKTLDIGKVQEELEEILSKEPDRIELKFGDPCTGDGYHSTKCQLDMEYTSKPCISKQKSVARSRQEKITMLDFFTQCGQNPSEANGMRLFEGIAADSSIYDPG
ncbi:hypothetical protein H2204_002344 [Knufia peltigerae]|uniref:Uncharacterized protein n=1 Tax=Knufia peltigerae TaxID=1002370 RepID=A0AA38YBC0_9EURO|nr:hypothetical protein H2204_002344 [Knufia peltigerae]